MNTIVYAQKTLHRIKVENKNEDICSRDCGFGLDKPHFCKLFKKDIIKRQRTYKCLYGELLYWRKERAPLVRELV